MKNKVRVMAVGYIHKEHEGRNMKGTLIRRRDSGNTPQSKTRIVILGGGFAGVTLAQRLERLTDESVELVLLSSENHLVFSPLLAEAVGREISPLHVVVPGRQMVRRTQWLTARAPSVDRATNEVHYISPAGERGVLSYDHLVIACGSIVDLSIMPGLATNSYPLKTLGDAVFLTNSLIGKFEEASMTTDQVERRRLLTVVIIGGGFSAVEVAGAIKDLLERALRYYPRLQNETIRIILLHRGDRIIPEMHTESLSEFALKKLRARGIEIRLNTDAKEIKDRRVVLASGEEIAAETVVCTVGNTTNPLLKTLGVPLEKGRLKTDPDMLVKGTPNVWALGDSAAVPNAWDRKPSPPTAQFATRQAKQLATNLTRALKGQRTRPFSYRPLGMMASIGHHNAVAEICGVRISGFLGWLLWRSVYLAKMPTLLRKVEVALDWVWSILFRPNIVQVHLSRSTAGTTDSIQLVSTI
jgi:NADH:ubiquinone reductase (H+-translocating)